MLCRRAQLRHCLEQLKKQVPLSSDSMRNTTLNLLRRAQLHIKVETKKHPGIVLTALGDLLPCVQCLFHFFSLLVSLAFFLPTRSSQKLQEQDERAEQLKGRLRWEQRELRVRLEQLQRGSERMRNDSQGSTMSSERSDSDRGRFSRGAEEGLVITTSEYVLFFVLLG